MRSLDSGQRGHKMPGPDKGVSLLLWMSYAVLVVWNHILRTIPQAKAQKGKGRPLSFYFSLPLLSCI